jgi:hypothetical protein
MCQFARPKHLHRFTHVGTAVHSFSSSEHTRASPIPPERSNPEAGSLPSASSFGQRYRFHCFITLNAFGLRLYTASVPRTMIVGMLPDINICIENDVDTS